MMTSTIQTMNCQGKLLALDAPIVMGVLNVTPDSFYDGGKYHNLFLQLKQVEKMVNEGATIIDVGGMSSRPGARLIPSEEEIKRAIPIVQQIRHQFPNVFVSIDTVYAKTAKAAKEAGAHIINDISAGRIDAEMYQTVATLDMPYILMHMQLTPLEMQVSPTYNQVIVDLMDFFVEEVGKLRALGVKDIVIDPGFGFGKTIEHNFKILKHLKEFWSLELPILVGISRKSMVYQVLNTVPEEALNGTTALHMVALQAGAKILRVHDVKPAMEVIRLFEQYHGTA